MATAIRDLFVSVTTKVDSGGLTALDGKLNGVKDKFGKFATFIAGGFIARGVSDFIKGQLDAADHLNDTSQKLGIATDDLERFGFVAQLSGSSAEAMYGALNKMNKAIGDNSDGFKKLGVDLKNSDGSARETGDVFLDVAENFNSLKSQGEKTAVAMQIFGKSGAELIPLLNGGGEATQKLIDRFEELGGATPEEFIRQAAEINDSLDELSHVAAKGKQQIVGALLPSLLVLAKGFVNVIAKITSFEKRTKLVTTVAKLLATSFAALKLVAFAGNIVKVAKAAMTLKNVFGGFKSALMTGGLMLAVLLIQDLITFATGGKSVIGDFMTALIGPEKAQEFAKQLNVAWSQVKDVLVGALPGAMSAIAAGLPGLIGGFLRLVDALFRVVKLLTIIGGSVPDVGDRISGFGKGIKDWFSDPLSNTRVLDDKEMALKLDAQKRMAELGSVFDGDNFGGMAGTKAIDYAALQSITSGNVAMQPGMSAAAAGWSAAPAGAPVTNTVQQTNNTTINLAAPDAGAAAAAISKALPATNKQNLRDAKGALASKAPKK